MDFDRYLENERIKNDLQEVNVYCECNDCGGEIYYGNDYYNDDGDILCEECFDTRQENEKKEKMHIAGEEY